MLETTWKNGIMKDGRSTAERCTEVPPFTFCGLEMFVLLIIKERRPELKCYGALVTGPFMRGLLFGCPTAKFGTFSRGQPH